MNKNIIKLALVAVFMLSLVAVSGDAAEGKKGASPPQTKSTVVEQEKAPPASKAPAGPATGEQINWQVISSGGARGTSINFVLNGTVGQTAVGYGNSANFGLSHGFWQQFGGGTCCNHDGIRGDVDMGGSINVGDIAYLVAYLFGTPPGPAPPCFEEADVDAGGSINVGDVAYLVAYLFATPSGPAPLPCP